LESVNRETTQKPGSTKWEDNIETDFREIGLEHVDWTYLAQARNRWRALVNTVMNVRVSWMAGDFLSS
jgi:hypothetical protein